MPWSDDQQCFQGGYRLPYHNWRPLAMHMPGLHKIVLSSFNKEREMSVLQRFYHVFRFLGKGVVHE